MSGKEGVNRTAGGAKRFQKYREDIYSRGVEDGSGERVLLLLLRLNY